MNYLKRTSSMLALAGTMLMLAACGQKSNCNGITFGGSGSGGSGGSLNGGGSVCGSSNGNGGGGGGGSSTALLYYLGSGTVISAANVNSTTFANVTGYTPLGFPNGTALGESFWVASGKFLYVPGKGPTGQGEVLGYQITRANAALTPIPSSPFPTSTTKADIAVSDPQGRFLFVSDISAGSIEVLKIDSTTGSLTLSVPPASIGGPSQMVVDGTGKYLYFSAGDQVFGFSIDQTSGALTALVGSPFSVPLRAFQIESTGQFLVGVSGLGDANVYVVPIQAGTGILGFATTFPTVSAPSAVAFAPNGKYLFTFAVDSIGNPLPIEGYTFDITTGTVTAMTGSPFVNLPKVSLGIFDQSGTVLIGATTTSFTAYLVDSTTGTPTSPAPVLGVPHDERFALTD